MVNATTRSYRPTLYAHARNTKPSEDHSEYVIILYFSNMAKVSTTAPLRRVVFVLFAIQISAGMMNGDAPSVDSVQPVSYYLMRCYMCIL